MVMGYYIEWGAYGRKFFPSSLDAARMTHVTYAFANISPEGRVVLGDSYADCDMTQDGQPWDAADKGNFGGLHRLRDAHPHLKLIISVGGWTWSANFPAAAATDASRKAFARSAADFVEAHGFDGLDLDWEYPADGNAHVALLRACRTELDALGKRTGKAYTLSIAVGMGPSVIPAYKGAEIAGVCDWVGLMAYDFHGGWDPYTGANAPMRDGRGEQFCIEDGVAGWERVGLPKDKMLLGVGFYGRGWSGVQQARLFAPAGGPADPGTWEKGVFDYDDIADNMIGRGDWERHWDEVSQTPFLYSPSRGWLISYDDEQSVGVKADYALRGGMLGALVWEFSSDRRSRLLGVLADKFLKADTKGAGQ